MNVRQRWKLLVSEPVPYYLNYLLSDKMGVATLLEALTNRRQRVEDLYVRMRVSL